MGVLSEAAVDQITASLQQMESHDFRLLATYFKAKDSASKKLYHLNDVLEAVGRRAGQTMSSLPSLIMIKDDKARRILEAAKDLINAEAKRRDAEAERRDAEESARKAELKRRIVQEYIDDLNEVELQLVHTILSEQVEGYSERLQVLRLIKDASSGVMPFTYDFWRKLGDIPDATRDDVMAEAARLVKKKIGAQKLAPVIADGSVTKGRAKRPKKS
jgi:hypothetical protein